MNTKLLFHAFEEVNTFPYRVNKGGQTYGKRHVFVHNADCPSAYCSGSANQRSQTESFCNVHFWEYNQSAIKRKIIKRQKYPMRVIFLLVQAQNKNLIFRRVRFAPYRRGVP
jgi:hypothetical protein